MSLDDRVLLVGGSGPDVSGWLFAINSPASPSPPIEHIDRLNTSGIVAVDSCLYRVLSSASETNAKGELLVYDTDGVSAYHRIDGLADSHGVIWSGTHLIVPCSYTNEVRWLSSAGATTRIWKAPGEGDAWHINGVCLRDGRLFASAFGVFSNHRAWNNARGRRTGIIFDVETQQPVITGLSCPHDPLFVDDGWLVCDSYTGRVLLLDEVSGNVRRTVNLNGWTRGVYVGTEHIYIGVSGARHGASTRERARVAVLNRSDWRVIAQLLLPCDEITTLSLVDRSFLPGLRRGFRTNDLRVAVQDRSNLFEAVGQAGSAMTLTPMKALEGRKNYRIKISMKAPRNVESGKFFEAEITLKNRGQKTFITAAPFPVNVALAFERTDGPTDASEVRREPLPEALAPGETIHFSVRVQSPLAIGRYRVRVTLIQEWVRWFDFQSALASRVSPNRCFRRMSVHNPRTGSDAHNGTWLSKVATSIFPVRTLK